jgi:hypothetical protein
MALPHRTFVISDEAAVARRDAGVTFAVISQEEIPTEDRDAGLL